MSSNEKMFDALLSEMDDNAQTTPLNGDMSNALESMEKRINETINARLSDVVKKVNDALDQKITSAIDPNKTTTTETTETTDTTKTESEEN